MTSKNIWLPIFASILGIAAVAAAAEKVLPDPAAAALASPSESLALAMRIDAHLVAGWSAAKVHPAPQADDAEFLRRVYLDLAGRIPSVAEARAFLKETAPSRRERLVEQLLGSQRHVTHQVNVWRGLLLPETSVSQQARFLAPGFEIWLREQLGRNVGYDEMVRELLTAPVTNNNSRFSFNQNQGSNPLAYFVAKESRPENVAAAAARVFLGIRLECAQCHDHPFAAWKQDQFWSLAAFFSGLESRGQGDFTDLSQEITNKRELTIPGTQRVVQAKFPDGSEPTWKSQASSRQTLADWIVASQNAYFSRAAVNRIWYQHFGHALAEPVDEMVGAESTVSHPELLNELAAAFAAHGYDMRYLIRAITASRAYQLTSARTEPGPDDPRLFARMPLRGLSSEQLLDSLLQATGRAFGVPPAGRDELLATFTEQTEQPTEFQTTILQALALMNGRLIADQTALERSDLLASVLDAPFLDSDAQIETIYLATLSRQPRPKELARAKAFIETSVGENRETARKEALADVFWAVLNSGEFLLNH